MPEVVLQRCSFLTPLGAWAIIGSQQVLYALTLGHDSVSKARISFGNQLLGHAVNDIDEDWFPELRKRLERYSSGHSEEFSDIAIYSTRRTPFQAEVISQTRQLKYGESVTYLELANRAGSPGAARAVGTVMSTNRIPIVIPCHRVIAAGGRLGGYSAPQGTQLKQQLLAMETGREFN